LRPAWGGEWNLIYTFNIAPEAMRLTSQHYLILAGVTDEIAVQLAAEKVDQHFNPARLNGLANNAEINCCMALSQ